MDHEGASRRRLALLIVANRRQGRVPETGTVVREARGPAS